MPHALAYEQERSILQIRAEVADAAGAPGAFLLAALTIIVWLVTGSLFHFSDTWRLLVNTGTTIVTFLMVFLIQNTHPRPIRGA
jgi:low affinity Fe/Cu permease